MAELHERQRTSFTLADVADITGLGASASRSLVHKAVQRGVVTRLKRGGCCLVPFELGHATEYVDSPYIIARELAGDALYFISHGTLYAGVHGLLMRTQVGTADSTSGDEG